MERERENIFLSEYQSGDSPNLCVTKPPYVSRLCIAYGWLMRSLCRRARRRRNQNQNQGWENHSFCFLAAHDCVFSMWVWSFLTEIWVPFAKTKQPGSPPGKDMALHSISHVLSDLQPYLYPKPFLSQVLVSSKRYTLSSGGKFVGASEHGKFLSTKANGRASQSLSSLLRP